MKYLIILLILTVSVNAENKYDQIHKRNAFALLDKVPSKVEVRPSLVKPPVKLNLTGIITRKGITNVYLFSKDIPKRYLNLSTKRRSDSGITLLSVEKGLVEIDNNGVREMLSFDTHKLPSIITLPALKTTPTIIKKKDDKSKEVKIMPQTPKANVVTVPSRRPKIDPRIIQRGLEYLDKVEDKEKREYILQRLEKLQSGQQNLDRKMDSNERRRQYDERKRDK